MRPTLLAAALLLTAGPIRAADYPAPNAGFTAKVAALAALSCESNVEVTVGSTVRGHQSFVSQDHESGSCVADAGWTPDSKFFVFSLQNSGGHQPWNSSIVAFSIEKNKFMDIEIGDAEAVTSPHFKLSAPSWIDFETTKFPLDANHPDRRRVDLESLR